MDLEGLTEKFTKGRWKTVYYENANGEIVVKICRKCNQVKVLSDYVKQSKGLGEKRSTCKTCAEKYRQDNKESIAKTKANWHGDNKEYNRKYYEANKERIAEANRKWRQSNPERDAELKRKWAEDNKEHLREISRYYYATNKERIDERTRNWRETNKERVAENKRNWNEVNKELLDEKRRIWYQNNPDKKALYHQRRRARKRLLPDDFSEEQMTETLEYFEGECALTGDSTDIHWDHVIPLATGYAGTVYGNMVPIRAGLNLSKGDANIFEWFEANRQRFNLEQERFDRLIEWLGKANGMTVEEYRDYVYECHANPNAIDDDVAN